MTELVVLSGKGGTGKTLVVASLAAFAPRVVLADCDVDAADLHLVLQPQIVRRENFVGGRKARVQPGRCTACGKCEKLCRFDAVFDDGPGHGRVGKTFRVDPLACKGCGVCARFCEEGAIEFEPAVCGQWFVSETRFGPMVHAELGVAAENSGKLVTQIRRVAQQLTAERNCQLLLCDGSPGIGCPVIASLTGASLALFVAEPTVSGLHDFRRVAELAAQLGTDSMLVVNKADLNVQVAEQLEQEAQRLGIVPVGRIPYDPEVTRAQIARRSVVEVSNGPAAQAIRAIWRVIESRLRTGIPAGRTVLPLAKV